MFLPPPDVRVMFDGHLLYVIIFVVPEIFPVYTFPMSVVPFIVHLYCFCFLWFLITLLRLIGRDFILMPTSCMYCINLVQYIFKMFNSFASSDITPEILSLVLFLSAQSSQSDSTFISSPLDSLKTFPSFGFFSTSSYKFYVGQYSTYTFLWLIWYFMKKYLAFMCFILFDIEDIKLFSIRMVLLLY